MNIFVGRAIGVLSIAGGVIAVGLFGSQLIERPMPLFGYLGTSVYVAIAAWGVFAGVLLLERDPRARWHNVWFWACQAPVILVPGIGHKLGIGAFLFVWMEYPFKLQFIYGMGAHYKLTLFKADLPFELGVNIVAIALAMCLYRSLPEMASNIAFKKDAPKAASPSV